MTKAPVQKMKIPSVPIGSTTILPGFSGSYLSRPQRKGAVGKAGALDRRSAGGMPVKGAHINRMLDAPGGKDVV